MAHWFDLRGATREIRSKKWLLPESVMGKASGRTLNSGFFRSWKPSPSAPKIVPLQGL
jgi:hypothetical protein